jgi:biofilm protein TabA
MHKRFATAFEYAANNALAEMEPGKYEIQGTDLFLLIQSYETRPLDQGFWEAHRSYIDIQYMLQGTEKMGYAHTGHLTVTEDHLDDRDYQVLEGEGDFLNVKEGCFTIFYPDDAHMPCLAVDQAAPVKKAVFKIRLA